MKITLGWLSEFVEITLPVRELGERLAMAGLELESVEPIGVELAGVVCAEVVQVSRHPAADQLSVCELRTGAGAAAVVTGATNVQAGMRVAYAAAGTPLPGGRRIEAADIRGVRSAGMLCSAAELGLGDDATGLLALPAAAAIGERIAAVLRLEDTVLELGITPNRGDCLSVLGIAREVAAITGARMQRQRLTLREAADLAPAGEQVSVQIADPQLCGRYVARVIEGVRIGPSPLWMQRRLRAVGMRPLNNLVDITNYVMIERGQPLHAFDFDRLVAPAIVVRRAGSTGQFTTLDGQARQLQPDDLLITTGEHALAIAGVMGGQESEVTGTTRRILLESAWFAPTGIRRTARRLGLRTEASYRFERGTDIDDVPHAADRAAALMIEISGGQVAPGRVDTFPAAQPRASIPLRLKRAEALLGVPLGRTEVTARLKALGVTVSPGARGALNAVPPSYRTDLQREIDLIEEIARVGGYEHIPASTPRSPIMGDGLGADERRVRDAKRFLAAQGLHEAVFLAFCRPRLNALFRGWNPQRAPVAVVNPVTQEDTELQLSLCPGLLRALRENHDQAAVADVALFSVGKVFWREDGFHEARHVAGILSATLPLLGTGVRGTAAEFTDLKGLVDGLLEGVGVPEARWSAATDMSGFHPGKTARIAVGDTVIGIAGATHPAVDEELGIHGPCWLFEIDMERLLQYGRTRIPYRELPRFPAVVRDLAVVADDSFASDQVVRFVRERSDVSKLVESIVLFDQYSGAPIPAGKKSLAYSLAYRAADRTLTDAEVNEAHAALIAALRDALPVEPR